MVKLRALGFVSFVVFLHSSVVLADFTWLEGTERALAFPDRIEAKAKKFFDRLPRVEFSETLTSQCDDATLLLHMAYLGELELLEYVLDAYPKRFQLRETYEGRKGP